MPRSLHSRRLVAERLELLGDLPAAGPVGVPVVPPRHAVTLSRDQLLLSDRVGTALSGWGAAVLAAPVGSGKTWVALHAAARRDGAIAVIGPAALRQQWMDTADRLSIVIGYTSLERVSLGHLPHPHGRIVLIDEAHRLRNPGTRRVTHLTPWLVGREVVFVTATPIVNGPGDLIRLLRLCLADDCLRLDGVPSLEGIVGATTPPHALTRLVVRGSPQTSQVAIDRRLIPPLPSEQSRGRRVLRMLNRLRLGETPAIRRLIRVVLLDAAASSDAAWQRGLRRYRTLLRHAGAAGGMSRTNIRAFVGACPEQGVLWELVRATDLPSSLPIDDLSVLDEALATPADDSEWIAALHETIAGVGPVLLFTRHLGTLRAVRDAMGPSTAWVSGEAAGIGPHRLPRGSVLSAFGPERSAWQARRPLPHALVLSDVGAEGLNLQGAACVVHLDVPWTDTGMRQRTGRAARIGQRAARVLEFLRLPPTPIDEALGTMQLVRRKAKRSHRWMRALDSEAPACPRAITPGPVPFETIMVVKLESGAQRGVIALGRKPQAAEWEPVELGVVEALQRRGALVETRVNGPLCPRLDAAIRRCTSPALIARPTVVSSIMAVAVQAARRRQVEKVAAVDRLLQAASRRHGAGLEQHLATASVEQLLACPALLAGAGVDRILEVWQLVPATPRRD